MRTLAYQHSPERHELFALFLINELMAARHQEKSRLRMMLPAVQGAEIQLPVPGLYSDLLGGRTRNTLHLAEVLNRFLDLGGEVQLAVRTEHTRMDASLLTFSQDLMARSEFADVRPFEQLSAFVAVGHHSAIEASMSPGPFRLETGIFRYTSTPLEIQQQQLSFDQFFKQGTHIDWKDVQP